MKKASKETYGKDIRSKRVLWEKQTHQTMKRVLSLSLRYPSIDLVYVPSALKKNQRRMIKSMQFRETMDPDDTNGYYTNNLERYLNWPNDLLRYFTYWFCE